MKYIFLFPFLALAAVSQAYDTFGPGDSYGSQSWGVNANQSIATPFTYSGSVGRLDLALLGSSTKYTITIHHGGDTIPGPSVYFWELDAPFDGIYSLGPTGAVYLPYGDYCVVAENAGLDGGWFKNDIGHQETFSYTLAGLWFPVYETTGVMRISSVPEPASLAALGLGAAAVLRRKKA